MARTPINRETLRKARQVFGVARPVFARHKWRLVAGFLSLICVNIGQLYVPRLIRKAVNSLEKGVATPENLAHLGILVLVLAIGVAFFRFGWRYLVLGFSRLLEKDLRTRLFAHVLTLDRPFFQKKPAGEIMALASNDLAAVQLAGGMGLIAFADSLLMGVATLACMAYIHPGLTLLAVLPMPLLAVFTSFLSASIHGRFKRVQEQFSKISEFARSSLSAIRLVKVYTQEQDRARRFDTLGQNYVKDNIKLAMVQGTLFPISGLVANTTTLLVLFFGGRLTISGVISIGDFVAFISYLFLLTWPTMALGWVANLFQRGITSLSRIKEIFDARPQLSAPTSPLAIPEGQVGFSFRDLTFSYDETLQPALKNLDLEIGAGVLGVVGRTGSGKSTLCHLLTRLYPVPDNSFFLEDLDVNALDPAQIRERISYVPQETMVFSDSIQHNISLGRPDASQDEIEAAAKAAAIHDEIMAMEKGYETRVGEKGAILSGGQKQRIALARALLLDRPILIIDDSLSAVDTQTEHNIIINLKPYLTDKICLVISHRLAPLAEADRIIVLEEGHKAEEGTHSELLEQNGLYAAIYEHQNLLEKDGGAEE